MTVPDTARRSFLGHSLAFAALGLAASGKAMAAVTCRDLVKAQPLIWRFEALQDTRKRYFAGEVATRQTVNALKAVADAALARPVDTVTDKLIPPPSGDVHDYTSLAPYWWPDPDQEDGKPYIRRDGETNPEREGVNFDKRRLQTMAESVQTLTLAGYLTDKAIYAEDAARRVRAWFIDPATRMNPNLEYGQSIPGRVDGRGIGIIDTVAFIPVIDSLLLLERLGAMAPSVLSEIRSWFTNYVRWLVTSEYGQDERATKNNHASYYDLQLAMFSAFAGDCNFAKARLGDVRKRINSQITYEGRMPLEEARTRSLHYYVFNSLALLKAARLGETLGVDLYNHIGPEGQSLVKTLTYLAPFTEDVSTWPHPQMGASSEPYLAELMIEAAKVYTDPVIAKAALAAEAILSDDETRVILGLA